MGGQDGGAGGCGDAVELNGSPGASCGERARPLTGARRSRSRCEARRVRRSSFFAGSEADPRAARGPTPASARGLAHAWAWMGGRALERGWPSLADSRCAQARNPACLLAGYFRGSEPCKGSYEVLEMRAVSPRRGRARCQGGPAVPFARGLWRRWGWRGASAGAGVQGARAAELLLAWPLRVIPWS